MIHRRLSFHIEILGSNAAVDDAVHLSGTFPTINSRVEDTRWQLCNELNICVDIKPIMQQRTVTTAARSHCNHHVRSTQLNPVAQWQLVADRWGRESEKINSQVNGSHCKSGRRLNFNNFN